MGSNLLNDVADYWRKVESGELPAPGPNEINVTARALDEAVSRIAGLLAELKAKDKRIAELEAKLAVPAPAVTIPDKVSCDGFNPKDWVEARNLGQREGWNAYRAAMLAATPPALRDGYCLMPQALTAENGAKYALSGEFKVSRTVTCNECGGDGCNDCGDAGEFEEEITIPWDTIKEIYRAAVNVCAQPNAAAKDDK